MPLRLKDPSIVRVGCDMGSERRGEGLAKQDVSVFAALAVMSSDLAGFEINIGDSEVAKFTDPDAGIEEQPQHQRMLDILGTVHDLVEASELVGSQDTGKTTPLFRRSKVTDLTDPLCDVAPSVVIES